MDGKLTVGIKPSFLYRSTPRGSAVRVSLHCFVLYTFSARGKTNIVIFKQTCEIAKNASVGSWQFSTFFKR